MKRLLDIQSLDSRLAEIGRLRQKIPKEIEELDENLQRARRALQQAKEELDGLKLKRRRKEKDLEVEMEKVRKAQSRLFEVKTNKEYQALLKEIEAAKKANSDLEEEILLIMEEMDQRAEALKLMEKEMDRTEKSISQKKKELQEKLMALDVEEKKAQALRREIASAVDPSWMLLYERIAKSHNGIAVVRVDGGTCQGCFVSIPPQLYNEILKGREMAQCPFCQRFLYHEIPQN